MNYRVNALLFLVLPLALSTLSGCTVQLISARPSTSTGSPSTPAVALGSAALVGAAWDSGGSIFRLGSSGGCDGTLASCASGVPTLAEINSTWTPHYANIVGYWKLEGTGSIADAANIPATIGPDGTADNIDGLGMAYSTGQLNNAITFDGVDDRVFIPKQANNTFDTNEAFSVQAWIYPTAAQDSAIFSDGLNGAPYTGHWIHWGASWAIPRSIAVAITDAAGNTLTQHTSDVFALNQWHHVLVTYDGSNSIYGVAIYVDGRRRGTIRGASSSATLPGSVLNAFDWAIGGTSNGAPLQLFPGKIDEVALWDLALSATDVESFYMSQLQRRSGTVISGVVDGGNATTIWNALAWVTTLPFGKELPDYNGAIENESIANYTSLSTGTLMNGILGLWHFDETSAGTAPGATDFRDHSGQGIHGSRSGAATIGTSGRFASGVGLHSATADYVNLPSAALGFGAGQDFTVSFWVNSTQPSHGGTWPNIANSEGSSAPRMGWNIALHNSTANAAWFAELWVSGVQYTCSGTSDVADGSWHHLAVQRSGSNLLLYQDGILSNTCAASNADIRNGSNQVVLGAHLTCGSICEFEGKIDEMGIWNRVLTSAELFQVYRRGANRVKFQVQTCTIADCSDQSTWLGPDGTNQTYFTELHNNFDQSTGGDVGATNLVLPGLPNILFSNFGSLSLVNNRYFRYRAVLESDDRSTGCNYGAGATACSPEIKSAAGSHL